MLYKKINVEVVAELNTALDRLEEKHTLSAVASRPSLSSTRDHGSDRHSRIRWPQVRRSQLLSELHVRA